MPPRDQPSAPIGKLVNGTIRMHLDGKELTADGHVRYLEVLGATAQFVMQLNGNGTFWHRAIKLPT